MKLLPTLALVGLLAACAAPPPDPNVHAATVHEVQSAAFQSVHTMYFQTVDDGSTYMQQLVEHVPVEHPDRITIEIVASPGQWSLLTSSQSQFTSFAKLFAPCVYV